MTGPGVLDLKAADALARRLKEDFPILMRPLTLQGPSRPLVYLDNAATTQKPRAVLDALTTYYESQNANVHRAIHALGEEATRVFEEARETVRAFLKARSLKEIVFTRGTTEAMNLVARTFGETLAPGDVILTTEMEHHANLVPWLMLAERRGVAVRHVPIHDDGTLNWDALEGMDLARLRLFTLTHMSNVLGTINDIRRAVAWAHGRGVPVLVDAAQSAPHITLDVQALDVDMLAFSSHKMAGPTGFGVLYVKEALLETWPPFHGGGEMIRSVRLDGYTVNDLPHRFEAGTPHIEGAVGLAAAIQYLQGIGLDWIHAWEQTLVNRALEGLDQIPGLRILGRAPDRGGVAAFTLEGVHAHDLSAWLDQRGIAVRAGHHCAHPLAKRLGIVSSARASFYLYNTLDDVDLLVRSVAEAARVL